MRAKTYQKGVFLYTGQYENLFNLLKSRLDYSYYYNDFGEAIYWFHTDEIIPLAEEILNLDREPRADEQLLIDFLTNNGFEVESCCGKWEISKNKPFENILFYT